MGFCLFYFIEISQQPIKESQMSPTPILPSGLRLFITFFSGSLDKKRNVRNVLVHLPEQSVKESRQVFIEPLVCAVCARDCRGEDGVLAE